MNLFFQKRIKCIYKTQCSINKENDFYLKKINNFEIWIQQAFYIDALAF